MTLGPHFVAVSAAGYQPFAGVVAVTHAKEGFAPSLRTLSQIVKSVREETGLRAEVF